MLRNYITIALRTVRRQAGYTALNVGGLAIGMACCILVMLYVQDELSFDRFHTRADRIYRVEQVRHQQGDVGASTPYPLIPALEDAFPDIERTVRLGHDPVLLTYGEASYREERFYWTDASFFDVFSFPLLRGDPATALARPDGLVLTESAARRYFGDADPLGRVMDVKVYDGNRTVPMEVTGVLADVPAASHLQLDALGSMGTGIDIYRRFETLWGLNWLRSYVLLPEGYPVERIRDGLPGVIERHLGAAVSDRIGLVLRPLLRIHLYAEAESDGQGDIASLYILGSIALFILALACINFINLTTARAIRRRREVSLRKVLGARRGQLARQFLGESLGLAVLALAVALGAVALGLPAFHAFTGKAVPLAVLAQRGVLLALAGLTLAVGVAAGSYPALYLSRFRPISVVKDTGAGGRDQSSRLRRGLVVVQFTIAIVLLAGTTVVHRQMDFLRTRDLGYQRERLLVVSVEDRDVQARMETIGAELARQPGVLQVAQSSEALPSRMQNTWDVLWEGRAEDNPFPMDVVGVDYAFFDLLGTAFVAGRPFSRTVSTDADVAFIVNESGARAIGWTPQQAVGQAVTVGGRAGTIVGVVEDFHHRSLRSAITPVVYLILPGTFRASPDNFLLRLAGDDLPGTVDALQTVWKDLSPEQPFLYTFVDQAFDAQYRAEARASRLLDACALLAVFVACLGLFGLAAYVAVQRTKEVGVRKVLGASVGSLVLLLSRDFLLLVLLAFVVAAPLAYVAMQRWLAAFAYRIDVHGGDLLLAGLTALGVALVAVGYHAVRAALADPACSLRAE